MQNNGDVYKYIASKLDDICIVAKYPKNITDALINQEYYVVQVVGSDQRATLLESCIFIFYFILYFWNIAVSIMLLELSLYHVISNIYTLIIYNKTEYSSYKVACD